MTDSYAPGHIWMWFVYDGDESRPISYNGADASEARKTFLRHAQLDELPAGYHIWHGSRRRPETVIIGSGLSDRSKRKPEPVLTIIGTGLRNDRSKTKRKPEPTITIIR